MKILKTFLLFVSFFFLYSCNKNEDMIEPISEKEYLEVSDDILSFPFRENSEEIIVSTNSPDWTFSSGNDWITVDSVRGKDNAIEIRTKPNYLEQRNGVVWIEAGDLKQKIEIIQHAFDDHVDIFPDFSPLDEVFSVAEAITEITGHESLFGHKTFFRSDWMGKYDPEEMYDFHFYTEIQYERVKNKEINSHSHYIVHDYMREIDGVLVSQSVLISRFVFQPAELIPFHFDTIDGQYIIKSSTIERLKSRGHVFSEQDEGQKAWFFTSRTVENTILCIKIAKLGTDNDMVVFGYGLTEELKAHIPKFI